MVAEPTLFLSIDEAIQVRAHTNRGGLKVYCVVDFIRMLSKKPMMPSEAELYWLGVLCNRDLWTEFAVMDQHPVLFPGPYSSKLICISAGGLLLLFLQMEQDELILEEYAEEARQRLDILAGGGGAEYVRDYDDGEVDEMMAVKDAAISQGKGLDGPPDDWPFFFDADKKTTSRHSSDNQSIKMGELKNAMGESSVDEFQKITGISGGGVVTTTSTTISAKLDKKTAFSIKDIIKEMELSVDHAYIPAMCKAVCTRFRDARPKSEMFSRQRQTYFYLHDREFMENLVREEYTKYLMKKVDEEFHGE
jgi:hypothetical protein